MKIGDEVYGFSIKKNCYLEVAPVQGKVVSFDEKTCVIWGLPPNHLGRPASDLQEEMVFLKIDTVCDDMRSRDAHMDAMENYKYMDQT